MCNVFSVRWNKSVPVTCYCSVYEVFHIYSPVGEKHKKPNFQFRTCECMWFVSHLCEKGWPFFFFYSYTAVNSFESVIYLFLNNYHFQARPMWPLIAEWYRWIIFYSSCERLRRLWSTSLTHDSWIKIFFLFNTLLKPKNHIFFIIASVGEPERAWGID